MRPQRTVAPAAIFVFVLVLAASAGRPISAAAPVAVRTFDVAGVPADEMGAARETASSILRKGGLVLEWRDCSGGCAEPVGAHDIILRIAGAPKSAPPGSLGYSVVDTRSNSGTLATVYHDRVVSTARRTGVAPAVLLGRAIAHEIAHLRLGTSAHTADGLMRARWSDRELRRNRSSDWTLSPEVVAQLSGRQEQAQGSLTAAQP